MFQVKRPIAILLAAVAVTGAVGLTVWRSRQQLRDREAAWRAEKARLQAALADAETDARTPVPTFAAPPRVEAAAKLSPAQIIEQLQRVPPGNTPRTLRQAGYWLEELSHIGPAALPAIRDFLATGRDVDWDVGWLDRDKGARGKLPGDFTLPPSLRFGLLDVVRQVGGPEAEDLLAVSLSTTGRGIEVAYLTRTLHDMKPGKYREPAVYHARELLAAATPTSSSPLDRDHLYNVLLFYNDGSYANQAQTLIAKSGLLERNAMTYLQRTLGPRTVPLVAQAYQSLAPSEVNKKEQLARLALDHVGADEQANELFQKAINDFSLTKDHRQNLIEDLNENGFADPKKITANDLPLIEKRIALIEKLAPSATDPVNAAAFKEAYKDLQEMRQKLLHPPPAPNTN